MNLQNLGVQEMNALELTTVDGGDLETDLAIIGGTIVLTMNSFWGGVIDGFVKGSSAVIEAHI